MSIAKKRAPRFRVGDPVSFLYGSEKVAGEIVEDRGLLGEYGRRLYRVRINPGREDEFSFEMPEEDIESLAEAGPAVPSRGFRQEFNTTYVREPKTNRWSATTRRGPLHRGVKARGAVGYSTGRWEGGNEGDESQAIVTVLLECDHAVGDGLSRVRPNVWPVLTAAAREFADHMFLSRHPDAIVVHEDGDDEDPDRRRD